jgi:hypothetical protein
MKAKKFLLAMAIVFGLGVFTSCEKTSTAEQDELYEQSIDRDEITEDDVV